MNLFQIKCYYSSYLFSKLVLILLTVLQLPSTKIRFLEFLGNVLAVELDPVGRMLLRLQFQNF